MTGLIDIDRNGIAVQAAMWAITQMDKIRAFGTSAMTRAA